MAVAVSSFFSSLTGGAGAGADGSAIIVLIDVAWL